MESPLGARELQEIEERAARATVGPWCWQPEDDRIESQGVRDHVNEPTHDWEYRTIIEGGYWTNEADKDFVENAREDIPRLLATIRSLQQPVTVSDEIATRFWHLWNGREESLAPWQRDTVKQILEAAFALSQRNAQGEKLQ
jgi:hypothetical protein